MELLYGKYLKGLEDEIFRRIGKLLAENTRAYVIVPAQAKFLMEQQIIERCGVSGFMMLEVISFEKLTERVLEKVNGRAIARVDSVGLCMLIREIMENCAGELRVLDAKKDSTLHEAVAKLILALRTEDIFPGDLREIAAEAKESSAEKLTDIALIYERLLEYRDVWDMSRAEDHAREYLCEYADVCGAEIIIHGFDIIPASRIRTVTQLLKAGCRITVTLEADEQDDVFSRQLRTMYALESAARAAGSKFDKIHIEQNIIKSPEILHIEENLYHYPTVEYSGEPEKLSLVCVRSRRDELIHAAQLILERAQELKLSDIAVLAANPSNYSALIGEIFPQAGISWFFENKRSLREHRLAVFVLKTAQIAAEGRWQEVPHLIKTRLLPIDDEEGDALLRYAREHGKKPGAYKNEWKNAPVEIEKIRGRAMKELCVLCEEMKEADAAEAAGLIAAFLGHCELEKDILLEEEMLRELGMNAEAQFASQIYEKTLHILNQTRNFARGIPRKELSAMLETGFVNTEIAVVPQRKEQVTVGDITHSIFPQKKLIIVLGANDGVLTSRMDGGLFSDREVEELNRTRFFPGYISVQDQRLFLRRAFTSSDELAVTYNTNDGPAAMAVQRLKRIFPKLREQQGKQLMTAKGMLRQAARELRMAADGKPTELKALSILAKDPEGYAQMERLAAAAAKGNSTVKLSEKTAERLYEKASNNVSRLETFYKCPYKQFISYGLRPNMPQEYEEDPLNSGTYVHALIESASKKLAKRGFAGLQDTELRGYISDAAEAICDGHNRGIFRDTPRYKQIEKFLQEEAFRAMAAVRDQLEGTGIAIDGTEREFGGRSVLEIDTPNGKVRLRGKIDRIDLLEKDGKRMVRVVDYKTGTPDTGLAENIRCGTTLQLITYLIAALSIYENAIPAAAAYMKVKLDYHKNEESLRNGYCLTGLITKEGIEEMNGNGCFPERARGVLAREELDELIDTAKKMIGEAVSRIAKGENSIEPIDGDACRYCDYADICCFDEAYAENGYRKDNAAETEE